MATCSYYTDLELELTQFDGDPLQWFAFWDEFSVSVDSRNDISPVAKFKLLRKSLSGSAAAACKGFKLTAANYEEVKAVLVQRFGNVEVAISAHLAALIKLHPAQSHSNAELTRVRDACEQHICGLSNLGLSDDMFGQVFAPIVLSKLPKWVRLDVRRRKIQCGDATWTTQRLLQLVSEEVQLRLTNDSFSGISKRNSAPEDDSVQPAIYQRGNSSPVATSSACFTKSRPQSRFKRSVQRKVTCAFCNGHHYSCDCSVVSDVTTRVTRLVESDRCFRCLSIGHRAASCNKRQENCYYCGKRNHHCSLCLAKFPANARVNLSNQCEVNTEPASVKLYGSQHEAVVQQSETSALKVESFETTILKSHVSCAEPPSAPVQASTPSTAHGQRPSRFWSFKYSTKRPNADCRITASEDTLSPERLHVSTTSNYALSLEPPCQERFNIETQSSRDAIRQPIVVSSKQVSKTSRSSGVSKPVQSLNREAVNVLFTALWLVWIRNLTSPSMNRRIEGKSPVSQKSEVAPQYDELLRRQLTRYNESRNRIEAKCSYSPKVAQTTIDDCKSKLNRESSLLVTEDTNEKYAKCLELEASPQRLC